MGNAEQIKHFARWNERNWDITDSLSWTALLELYDIFKNTNRECSIKNCIEENESSELNEKYNTFAEKYRGFNKFIDGEWETRF